ncbi:MAG: SCO family protein [Candidatus Hydrogenedentes bacterium]|nr:SCO family protein [Candidatus Hydrogenedentota bacterium]
MNFPSHGRHVCALMIAATLCVSAHAQVLTAPAPPEVGIDQKLDSQVPLDLTFRDENGKTVTLGSLMGGKPAVLSLVYYECPMLCGEVLQGMLAAFNELDFTIGNEYQVLTVSFDPKETSELAAMKKKNMLEHYRAPEAAEGWHFLTGDEENIKKLAEVVGFRYQYIPSSDQYAHGSGIMVLTPEGKVSRYFYGIEYPKRDLRFGLIEASENRIGSLADELMLLCYHYDPMTGTYGLVIMSVLRLAGVATVLGSMALVGGMLVQERRRRRKTERAGAEGSVEPVPTR